jgi:hypothetical protein
MTKERIQWKNSIQGMFPRLKMLSLMLEIPTTLTKL